MRPGTERVGAGASRGRQILLALAIAGMTFLAYFPALRAGFIWDDDLLITRNTVIRADDGLFRIWWPQKDFDDFPLTRTAFWCEWRLWGAHAAGYHAVNIALHALVALLLWRLLLTMGLPGAWFAAALFALHPVNVASVAWVSEQKNTLALLWAVLAILAFLRYEQGGRRRWYGASLGLYFLALASKTSVVMLPVILLLMAWWRRGVVTGKDLRRTAPFFLLSAAMGTMTIWFQTTRAIGGDIVHPEGWLSRLATAGGAVWFYLAKVLAPVNLMMVYPRWSVESVSPRALIPAAALALVFVILFRARQRWGRGALFGLSVYTIMLLPVLGFVDMYYAIYSLVADHWQYPAIIGILALLAAMATRGLARSPDIVRGAAALLILFLLGALTWRQAGVFQDEEKLWRDTLRKNPACWIAQSNLGTALGKRGALGEAEQHLREAIKLRPDFSKTHNNLGFILAQAGRADDARRSYRRALELRPDDAEANKNLADLFAAAGQQEAAGRQYQVTLALQPDYAEANNNFGALLARQGQMDKALAFFRKAVETDPDYAEAWFNVGSALEARGRLEEAIAAYRNSVRLNPDLAITRMVLADALAKRGAAAQAAFHYREALRLNPDWPQVRDKLEALQPAQRAP